MMKRLFLILVSFVSLFEVAGQTNESDTLIYAQGKIINAATKELVVARISYQSLPYGSKVGVLSGSSFLFPLFDNEKYSLIVEAAGFAPSKFMLDPAEANADRRVIKDIELAVPGTVAVVAETTNSAGKVMRLDNLIFNVGTAKINPESFVELDDVVKMLKDNPRMVIQLEGHTDFQGNPKANMELSQERVDAVKSYLVSKGANKNRIKTKAFGGTSPLSRENTEEAHKLNRRVELRILEN